MGGKQSNLRKQMDIAVQTQKDDRKDSDDSNGCCIKINKLRLDTQSSFSCCIKGDQADGNIIIVGDKNKIQTVTLRDINNN